MPLLGFCAHVCWTSREALKCSVLNCEWRSVLRQSVVYTSLHHRPVDRGPPNMRKCHETRKKVQKASAIRGRNIYIIYYITYIYSEKRTKGTSLENGQ